MNFKKLFAAILIGLAISVSVTGQEILVSSGQNPASIDKIQKLKSGIILELPFIDDFSDSEIYPNSSRWADNNAFINNNYPINQPSYGVATMDAIDSLGNIYSDASVQSYRADYLTSHPINMNVGADSTIYLSFYYQARGLGDEPEPGDSLVLEFYSPQSGRWHWAWSSEGKSMDTFEQALINIQGAAYLQEGFRFRFVNYASLADSYEASLKVNADHWHIDYIYLAQNRHYRDTIMPDIALVKPVGTLLLDYYQMPWQHFQTIGISAVKSLFPLEINNLSGDRRYYTPKFKITDAKNETVVYEIELQAEEIRAFEELKYDATFNYSFDSEDQDTAIFKVSLDLQATESDMIPSNTVLESIQYFGSSYAYDDGSAEAGYGLVGEGASNGRVAYKFENLLSADSLVGVEIFFNKSFENANHKYFRLGIWNEIDNQPGDLLYTMTGLRSGLNKGLKGFDTFKLDTAQLVPSVFYIGWIQVTNDFLNIGFDRNNDNGDKIFYTLDGIWRNTSYTGSLMIRPVFSNKSKKTGIQHDIFIDDTESLNVYPNPASSFINIDYPDSWSGARLSILDIHGRIVYTEQKIRRQLNLPSISTGTYFLIIQNQDGGIYHQKLLIRNE